MEFSQMDEIETSQMEGLREDQVSMTSDMHQHQLSVDLNAWMQEANGIVERYKLRGSVLPRFFHTVDNQTDELEHNDASKLDAWKKIVNNKPVCPPEVLSFLNSHIPHWQDITLNHAQHDQRLEPYHLKGMLQEAHDIAERCKHRGGHLPNHTKSSTDSNNPDAIQETKDALKLYEWKHELEKRQASEVAMNASGNVEKSASDDLALREFLALWEYLDHHIRGWRDASNVPAIHHNISSATAPSPASVSAMETARGIYNRYVLRSCQLPLLTQLTNTASSAADGAAREQEERERDQENRDAMKLNEWKQAALQLGNRKLTSHNLQHHQHPHAISEDVLLFLDEHMPLWREKVEKQQLFNQKAMLFAQGIVERFEARGGVMPVRSKECKMDQNRAQEYRDAAKLNDWKQSLKGNKTKTVCCEEVRLYLDEKMPQWREVVKETHNDPMAKAVEIVQRFRDRGMVMPREWRDHANDPVRAEEYKDASKLRNWKRALKGNGTHNCPDSVRDFLDHEMPNWRKEVRKQYTNPMVTAREIVERYNLRDKVLPRHFSSNRNDPDRQQEYKDAKKLYDWKQGLKGLRFYRCSVELKEYLDANIPGWNDGVYSKASLLAEAEKSKSSEGGGVDETTVAQEVADGKTEHRRGDGKVVSVSVPLPMSVSSVSSSGDNPVTLPLVMPEGGEGEGRETGLLQVAKKRLRDEEQDGMDMQHHQQQQQLAMAEHQHHLQQQQQLQHQQQMLQHQQQQQHMGPGHDTDSIMQQHHDHQEQQHLQQMHQQHQHQQHYQQEHQHQDQENSFMHHQEHHQQLHLQQQQQQQLQQQHELQLQDHALMQQQQLQHHQQQQQLQQHHQQQQQHQELQQQQQQQDLSEQLLLPLAKVPRVMETKEV